MSAASELKENLGEMNPEAILLDGFDEALIGTAGQGPAGPTLAAYSVKKIKEILREQMGGGKGKGADPGQDVDEYFDFNIAGLWAGEHTPILVYDEEM